MGTKILQAAHTTAKKKKKEEIYINLQTGLIPDVRLLTFPPGTLSEAQLTLESDLLLGVPSELGNNV